ncbi:MAG: hypothetical protein ACRD8O_07490 [Bryobacteraceae bacterium]
MRTLPLSALALLTGAFAHGEMPAKIQINNLEAGASSTVLFAGAKGLKCDKDSFLNIGSSVPVDLPTDIAPRCWSCSTPDPDVLRVGVFSRGRALQAFSMERLCKNPGPTLNIDLKDRKKLVVHVWLAFGREFPRPNLDGMARDEIINTDWVLNENRTGLTLDAIVRELPKTEDVSIDCDVATKSSTFFDGSVLNVYYGRDKNRACRQAPIVYTQAGGGVLGDLTHEIAHSLGLHDGDHRNEYEGGHVNDVPGFNCTNTLFVASDILEHSLSLGQAFWMNFNRAPSSIAASPGVPCATKVKEPSKCIPISTNTTTRMRERAIERLSLPPGARESERCRACSVTQVKNLLKGRADRTSALVGRPRHCTQESVDELLTGRFTKLQEHAGKYRLSIRVGAPSDPGSQALRLGSSSASEFRRQWRLNTAISIAAGAFGKDLAKTKSNAKLDEYLGYLRAAVGQGSIYGNQPYLKQIIAQFEKQGFNVRCATP